MSGKTEQVQTRGIQLLTLANRNDVGDTELGGEKWLTKISEQAYSVWNNYQKSTVEFLENNSFRLSTSSGNTNGNGLELPVRIKPNTDYTLSYNSDVTNEVNIMQMDLECNKLKESASKNKQYSFHSEANAEWVILKFRSINNGAYVAKNIQFEEGTVATVYEPYTDRKPTPSPDYPQPIETTPQGVIIVDFTDGISYQTVELNCPREFTKWDRLEKIDGVWNWVFRSKEITLNGSEPWNKYADDFVYTIKIDDAKSGYQRSYCDKLKNTDVAFSDKYKSSSWIYSDHPTLKIKYFRGEPSINTIELWKDWISKNKPKLIYEVEEPELIPLPQSEQDKLNALTMYAPNTEITNTGGCNMELTYTVDTKAYVDAKIASVVKSVVETQKALL